MRHPSVSVPLLFPAVLAVLMIACSGALQAADAPTTTAVDTLTSSSSSSSTSSSGAMDFDHEHVLANAALASSNPDAMSQVLDSSAGHGDGMLGGGGDVDPTTLVPVVPGEEPVIVGGSLGGTVPTLGDDHGTTPEGFGTSPQGFGTSSHGFGSSSQGFGSNAQGFGGTPSQPGSGAYSDPSVDYGHHLQPVPGENAPAPSAQRP
jgi:hypothetical protein